MKSRVWGVHSHRGLSQPQASPSGQAVREQTGPWSPRCCKAHRCKCQEPPLWPPQSEWSHPPSRSNPGSAGAQTAEQGATVRGQKLSPGFHQARPQLAGLGKAPASLGQGLSTCPGRMAEAAPDCRPPTRSSSAFPEFSGGEWRGPGRELNPHRQHLNGKRVYFTVTPHASL